MTKPFSICVTCGVEFDHPLPETCPICADERQYLPEDGVQRWTTLEELSHDRTISITYMEPSMYAIEANPAVGIGQRSVLVQTSEGNLLWDPIGYIDDNAISAIAELGGIRWVAGSHPHMYGVQCAWAAAFEGARVLISERDATWAGRFTDALEHWDGELNLTAGLTLHRVGGHFAGSAVVHWRAADGKGVLLSGDSIFTVPAAGWVTFMRSYPNRIPLSGGTVRRIADQVLQLEFDRLYNNFSQYPITENAHEVIRRSADRHIAWVTGEHDELT